MSVIGLLGYFFPPLKKINYLDTSASNVELKVFSIGLFRAVIRLQGYKW